ncbi:MAG: hypothetical protein U0165_07030 [Polyangiaceae bacterium]
MQNALLSKTALAGVVLAALVAAPYAMAPTRPLLSWQGESLITVEQLRVLRPRRVSSPETQIVHERSCMPSEASSGSSSAQSALGSVPELSDDGAQEERRTRNESTGHVSSREPLAHLSIRCRVARGVEALLSSAREGAAEDAWGQVAGVVLRRFDDHG